MPPTLTVGVGYSDGQSRVPCQPEIGVDSARVSVLIQAVCRVHGKYDANCVQ